MSNLFVVSLVLVIVAALITILYAFFIFYKIGKIKIQNKNVADISSYIRSGAMTFLKREYKIIIIFVCIVTVVLAVLGFIPALSNAEGVGWQSSICFLIGAVFSALTGIIGMLIATKANARTADAVEDGGMRGALRVAFSGGAVIGLCVVGFGLLGLTCLIFLFVGCAGLGFEDAVKAAVSIVSGYGLGCYYKLGITYAVMVGIAMVVGQYCFARYWFSNHQRGPLEGIWRKLTWIGEK